LDGGILLSGLLYRQNRRKLIDLFSNSFLDRRNHLELMKRRKDKANLHSKNKKVFIVGLVIAAIAISGILAIFLPSVVIHNANYNDDQAPKSLLIKEISNPTYPSAPALGSSKAKVTMVEFGDYQCHFCARFQRDTKDSILQNFVNTGQVRFLFKDFTVNDKPGDKASTLAAEASYCAADQGKYWQYHDEIYKNSKGESVAWVTKDILKQFASNVKIPNIKKFSECLDSQNHSNIVEQNDNLAKSIGLQYTPSFILLSTGKSQQQPLLMIGAQPYSVFQLAIAKVQSST
jgi:protein-disulfide isomerase